MGGFCDKHGQFGSVDGSCPACFTENANPSLADAMKAMRSAELRRRAEENLERVWRHREMANLVENRMEVKARLAAIEAKLDGLAKPEAKPEPGYYNPFDPPPEVFRRYVDEATAKQINDGVSATADLLRTCAIMREFCGFSPRGETKDEKSK